MWEFNLRSHLIEAKNRFLGNDQPKTEARILATEQRAEERKRGAENVFNQVTSAVQKIVDAAEFEKSILVIIDSTDEYFRDVEVGSPVEIRTHEETFYLKILVSKFQDGISIGVAIFPSGPLQPNLNFLLRTDGAVSERIYSFTENDYSQITLQTSLATHKDYESLGFGKALFFTSHLIARRTGDLLQKRIPTLTTISAVIRDAATKSKEAQTQNYTGWTSKMARRLGYNSTERKTFEYQYILQNLAISPDLASKSRQI